MKKLLLNRKTGKKRMRKDVIKARLRRWVFTLNNPTGAEEQRLIDLDCRFIIFQHEDEGTHHLQGYVEFHKPKRMRWIKGEISRRIHLEDAGGNLEENVAYCTKEGGWNQFWKGEAKKELKLKFSQICDKIVDQSIKISEIAENHPKIYAMHHKGLEKLAEANTSRS